ncbi:MAG: hypothetical protein KGY65_01365 [Candidatus Thermoplasmatota archaeon]|nr:hypothetical protein [Candidatus Thermoplasmatota archaeon]
MKKNLLIYILTIGLILITQLPMISAADFEIINTDYTVDEARSNENNQYYTIFVTMRNTKNTPFENLTVKILDEYDIPTQTTYSFQPQETKIFTFEDMPFAGGTIHQVTVTYEPENTSRRTSSNTGLTTFNITYNPEKTTDTPFIHPLFTLFTLLFITVILKKKKQK